MATNDHRGATTPAGPGGPGSAPGLRVVRTAGTTAVRAALDALGEAETKVGVPLVDESERQRLERAVEGEASDPRWVALTAHREAAVVGYAGVRLPDREGAPAVGDAAPFRLPGAWSEVLPSLIRALRSEVAEAGGSGSVADVEVVGAEHLEVWVRHVAIEDLGELLGPEVAVERRLGILGRDLDVPVEVPTAPAGVQVRAFVPDDDDAGVVDVLATAYEGTGDGGWDLERFRERRGLPWFRAEDLLVAVGEDGEILGLHWLKRRDATSGEVYNLAIHPRAQGQGLGPVLLGAGLEHLRAVGCDDVLLWVDLANRRAVRVYEAQGFTKRWEDVALRVQLP